MPNNIISPARLSQIEAGTAEPTKQELVAMARTYRFAMVLAASDARNWKPPYKLQAEFAEVILCPTC